MDEESTIDKKILLEVVEVIKLIHQKIEKHNTRDMPNHLSMSLPQCHLKLLGEIGDYALKTKQIPAQLEDLKKVLEK